jgi:predicted GNAT superfamily acetyltransferase
MAIRLASNFYGRNLLRVLSPLDAYRQYNKLAQCLYPEHEEIVTKEQFLRLLDMPNQLIVFRVRDGQMVSTAQANLLPVYPNWQVFITNVVTLSWHKGRGHGLSVMEDLIKHARKKWGRVQCILTNNKNKGNSTFYTKNGWKEVPTSLYTYVR